VPPYLPGGRYGGRGFKFTLAALPAVLRDKQMLVGLQLIYDHQHPVEGRTKSVQQLQVGKQEDSLPAEASVTGTTPITVAS
jgi:hypothetical protein